MSDPCHREFRLGQNLRRYPAGQAQCICKVLQDDEIHPAERIFESLAISSASTLILVAPLVAPFSIDVSRVCNKRSQ